MKRAMNGRAGATCPVIWKNFYLKPNKAPTVTTPAQSPPRTDTAMMRAGIAAVLHSEPGNHMALDLKWALDRIVELEAENQTLQTSRDLKIKLHNEQVGIIHDQRHVIAELEAALEPLSCQAPRCRGGFCIKSEPDILCEARKLLTTPAPTNPTN